MHIRGLSVVLLLIGASSLLAQDVKLTASALEEESQILQNSEVEEGHHYVELSSFDSDLQFYNDDSVVLPTLQSLKTFPIELDEASLNLNRVCLHNASSGRKTIKSQIPYSGHFEFKREKQSTIELNGEIEINNTEKSTSTTEDVVSAGVDIIQGQKVANSDKISQLEKQAEVFTLETNNEEIDEESKSITSEDLEDPVAALTDSSKSQDFGENAKVENKQDDSPLKEYRAEETVVSEEIPPHHNEDRDEPKVAKIKDSTIKVQIVRDSSEEIEKKEEEEELSNIEDISEAKEEKKLEEKSSDTEAKITTDVDLTVKKSHEVSDSKEQEEKTMKKDQDLVMERVVVDYASKSAGALILDKSSSFKGTSNLLNSNKDSYAIAPCEDKKFVVVSLSEDIMVKKVKLANYERYSSPPKEFQVLGSQTIDGGWVDLGTYTASVSSGVQVFDLKEPSWVRYLQFRFLTHYQEEHYCTVSQIMVHGNTVLQGFHEQWKETEEETQKILEQVESANNTLSSDDITESNDASSSRKVDGVNESEEKDQKQIKSRAGASCDSKGTLKCEHENAISKSSISATSEVSENKTASTVSHAKIEGVFDNSNTTKRNRIDSKWTNQHILTSETTETINKSIVSSSFIGTSSVQSKKRFVKFHPLRSAKITSINLTPRKTIKHSQRGKSQSTDFDVTKSIKSVLNTANNSDSTFQIVTEKMKSFLRNVDNVGVISSLTNLADIAIVKKIHLIDKRITIPDLADRINLFISKRTSIDTDETLEKNVSNIRKVSKESKDVTNKYSDVVTMESKSKSDNQDDQEQKPSGTGYSQKKNESFDSLHDSSVNLSEYLDQIAGAECLKALNYAEFKAKIVATKGGSGNGGNAHPGNGMAPIFKKLTDEIKSLQISLSVHDQFTRETVSCYQRVLFDLIIELEVQKRSNEVRLSKLEEFRDAVSGKYAVEVFEVVQQLGQSIHFLLSLGRPVFISLKPTFIKIWECFVDITYKYNRFSNNTEATVFLVVCILFVFLLSSAWRSLVSMVRRSRKKIGKDDYLFKEDDSFCTGTIIKDKTLRIGEGSRENVAKDESLVQAATALANVKADDIIAVFETIQLGSPCVEVFVDAVETQGLNEKSAKEDLTTNIISNVPHLKITGSITVGYKLERANDDVFYEAT